MQRRTNGRSSRASGACSFDAAIGGFAPGFDLGDFAMAKF
jgi:hypothetical protein